jgi:hypothetical protein
LVYLKGMKYFAKLTTFVAFILLLAIPILFVSNVQAIEDWWSLRGYVPSDSVIKLADEDTMTDKARHMFYVNHPELISDKTKFRSACPLAEQTIVLGCYYQIDGSFREGIAVFDVSDARLSGVEEVTSAHEMLHSAYDRLSSSEKDRVDKLLMDYYNNSLHDDRIAATIESYKKTEPKDVVNEMHSIFGTEVTDLPAPLEDYYKQYFNNRRAITNFSNQYESVFAQNKAKLDNLKTQIDQLKSQLSTDKSAIEQEQNALAEESNRMQGLLSSGKNQQYNAAVEPYNARVASLRRLITSYNSNVNRINSLVEEYNGLAYVQESLYDSLDTRIQTQTAQ